MNKEELLEREKTVLFELKEARQSYYDAQLRERSMKSDWEMKYKSLVLNETEIDPPGGGRWNETKREIYLNDKNDGMKYAIDELNQESKFFYLQLKQAEAEYEHIGRIVKIYSLED